MKTDEPKPEKIAWMTKPPSRSLPSKGVVTQLKAEQKAMQEKLIAAERRADENTRKFELLAREIEHGLIDFDAQGFISFSNPLVRKVLAVDTWSRRRYAEIFHDIPPCRKSSGACFETGTEVRKKTIEFQGSDGSKRRVDVSVLPTRDRSGAVEFVACVFREVKHRRRRKLSRMPNTPISPSSLATASLLLQPLDQILENPQAILGVLVGSEARSG
jgi:PAS domain-containing protein